MICQIKFLHLTEECNPTKTLDIKQFLKPTVSWNYVMLRESSSFILFMMWISHLYVMSDVLIDNLNWVKYEIIGHFQIQEADKCNVYDTVVFEGPPKTEQTLWPRHCVQESWGAELHKDLKVSHDVVRDRRMTESQHIRSTPVVRSFAREFCRTLTRIQHFLTIPNWAKQPWRKL